MYCKGRIRDGAVGFFKHTGIAVRDKTHVVWDTNGINNS